MIPDKIYIPPEDMSYSDKLEIHESKCTVYNRNEIYDLVEYTRTPQKVYVVETLLDHIKDLWELYAIYNNFKQAQEKANSIINGRVSEWDIEPQKNN